MHIFIIRLKNNAWNDRFDNANSRNILLTTCCTTHSMQQYERVALEKYITYEHSIQC